MQLSTIASQPALGAELLSWAFKSAPTHPSSAGPQKEPILAETTDASRMAEDENPPTLLPNVAKVSPQNF